MLNFNKVLGSWRNRPPEFTSQPEYHSDEELRGIHAALQTIKRDHSLIYVALGRQSERSFQSIILDVDTASGWLEIDELFPDDLRLQSGDYISVTIRRSRRLSVTFHSRVLAKLTTGNAISYQIALPSHLDGHQRREAYRLKTRGQAHWRIDERSFDQPRITDISISGVQLAVPREMTEHIRVGEDLENCRLQLSDLDFSCDLHITRKEPDDEQADFTTIGARMVTLDPLTRRRLEKFIMNQQRYQRLQHAP